MSIITAPAFSLPLAYIALGKAIEYISGPVTKVVARREVSSAYLIAGDLVDTYDGEFEVISVTDRTALQTIPPRQRLITVGLRNTTTGELKKSTTQRIWSVVGHTEEG